MINHLLIGSSLRELRIRIGTAGMLCAATTAFAVGVLGVLAGYVIYNTITD